MTDARTLFNDGTQPAHTAPTTAVPSLHTVECTVCGAHVHPNGRGQRPGPHKQLRIRAGRDESGKIITDASGQPVAEVYEVNGYCDGGQLATTTRRHNAMSRTAHARITNSDSA